MIHTHLVHIERYSCGETLSSENTSMYFTPIKPQDPSIDHFATFGTLISRIASVETVTWFCNKLSHQNGNQ